jgi:hypothetical protein
LSKLDVEGGIAIGTAYSGATAAPTNGAIIEGNVGIGTATPTETLEVAGNVKFSGDIIGSGVGSQMVLGQSTISGTDQLLINGVASHHLRTEITGGIKGLSVIRADGRVGVGWDSAGPYKFIVVNDSSLTSIARFYDNGASNLVLDIAETGQVKIGGTVSNANAILDIKNTTKALHLPTLTTTTRDGLTVGASDAGLLILNDTTKKLNFYNGTAWEVVTSV